MCASRSHPVSSALRESAADSGQYKAGVKRNKSVYSPLVVLWLLVAQRLHGGASLEAAVLELLQGLPTSFWPQPCKRIRDWHERGQAPSSNTGAYNQARQALPLSIVEKAANHIFEQLVAQMSPPAADGSLRILDQMTIYVQQSKLPRRRRQRSPYPKGVWKRGAYFPTRKE
jgi:hypothetical protein